MQPASKTRMKQHGAIRASLNLQLGARYKIIPTTPPFPLNLTEPAFKMEQDGAIGAQLEPRSHPPFPYSPIRIHPLNPLRRGQCGMGNVQWEQV